MGRSAIRQTYTSVPWIGSGAKPDDRSIASTQARFGIHQFVQSPAYSCSTKCIRGQPGWSNTSRSENG